MPSWFLIALMHVSASVSLSQFELCVTDIADRYFTRSYLLFVYWSDGTRRRSRAWFGDTVPELPLEDALVKVFSDAGRWMVKVFTNDVSDEYFPSYLKTRDILFFMDGRNDSDRGKLVEELRTTKRIALWRSQGQILVVIRPTPGSDGLHEARSVLEALWTFTKACNAVVMIVAANGTFQMYKWYPYTDPCDGVGDIHLVDEWSDGRFKRRSELFTPVTNLNGCPLKVGAFTNPPYVLPPEGDPTNFTRGLDIQIVQQLSDCFNFSLRYVTLPEGTYPYIIFNAEGVASGFHAMLQRQELDIMVFGVRIHELRNMLADPLDSYIEDALVWVVPTPGLIPSWRNLGDAFTPTVWIVFGVFFVVIASTLYLAGNFRVDVGAEHPMFRTCVSCTFSTLAILLNNSVATPRSDLLRFLVFLFSLFAINASAAYQSSLFSLLTETRYEKPYVTPMDAVRGGVKTYLFPSGNITYNQTDHSMWNIIFQPDRHAFIEDFPPVIREIALEKTAMVMMSQYMSGFEIRTKYMTQDNTPQAMFLKEKFSLYRVTAYVSSGHPLRERFRSKVNQMLEGGLIWFWLQDLFATHQQFSSKQDEGGTKPLSMTHLQGPFFILLIALLFSFQVFCLEIAFQRLTRNLKTKIL